MANTLCIGPNNRLLDPCGSARPASSLVPRGWEDAGATNGVRSGLRGLLVLRTSALGNGAGWSALVLLLRMTAADTSLPSAIDDGLWLHRLAPCRILGHGASCRRATPCVAGVLGSCDGHARPADAHQDALRCPASVRGAERRSTRMRAVSLLTVAHRTGCLTVHGRWTSDSWVRRSPIGYRVAYAKTPNPRLCRRGTGDRRLLR